MTNTIPIESGGHTIIPDMDWRDDIRESTMTSQSEALYYMMRGDNILLCGQAGTGKSWVIQVFRNAIDVINAVMEPQRRAINLTITASTGAAAALINGVTIHSWSGLGRDVDPPDPDEYDETGVRRVIQSPKWRAAFKRIKSTDILVIDEISMLPAYFLTNLETVCRMAKSNDKPFGGIQVIMVGDYLQLPPVSHGELGRDGEPVDGRLCFFSPAFKKARFKFCYLDRIRRSDDDRLTTLLNDIRSGEVPRDTIDMLLSRMDADRDPVKSYTRLYTKNRDVNSFNKSMLDRIHGTPMSYATKRHGPEYKDAARMQRNGGIPDELILKRDALVMLTSNSVDREYGHVNGSMGRVVALDKDYATVMFNDGVELDVPYVTIRKTHKELIPKDDGTGMKVEDITDASVEYLPLKLAWAITVHKSQGQTLDGAIIDLTQCFQRGLGYVALSRVHSLDDIILMGSLPKEALMLDNDAFQADRILRRKARELRDGITSLMEEYDNKTRMLPILHGRERTAAEKWIRDNPSPHILDDDLTAYEWLQRRAKRHAMRG